jgi:putative oxidoreductase
MNLMPSKIIHSSLRILFGALTFYGGVLHFFLDVAVWKNAFLTSLYDTHYLWQIIGVINLLAGTLLIVNRYTIITLLILLPITFNILLYHIFFYTSAGLYIGIPMFALNIICIWQLRSHYKPLLQLKNT